MPDWAQCRAGGGREGSVSCTDPLSQIWPISPTNTWHFETCPLIAYCSNTIRKDTGFHLLTSPTAPTGHWYSGTLLSLYLSPLFLYSLPSFSSSSSLPPSLSLSTSSLLLPSSLLLLPISLYTEQLRIFTHLKKVLKLLRASDTIKLVCVHIHFAECTHVHACKALSIICQWLCGHQIQLNTWIKYGSKAYVRLPSSAAS